MPIFNFFKYEAMWLFMIGFHAYNIPVPHPKTVSVSFHHYFRIFSLPVPDYKFGLAQLCDQFSGYVAFSYFLFLYYICIYISLYPAY